MTVLLMLRSAAKKASAPSDKGISELNHTPHATAVYASRPALPPDSRNTRFQAARYALPGLDFHQLTAPASWRTSTHPTIAAIGAIDVHILITGAAGMIGHKLTARLAKDGALNGQPINRMTLLDVVSLTPPAGFSGKVEAIAADLAASGEAAKAIAGRWPANRSV